MTSKIIAIQGNHPSKLNPITDTSIFLANEIQNKKYKIFYYDPKNLSIINSKVVARGFFIKFNYKNKNFFKILKRQALDLTKCKFILIRQDPPFNLEYISTTYILDRIKNKVKIVNNPSSIRNISEKLYSAKYQRFMPSTIFTQDLSEIKSFIKKHKKIITRKGQFDKPDGTPSEKGSYVSKSGEPVLNYWDLDANGWRNATGLMRIKWN